MFSPPALDYTWTRVHTANIPVWQHNCSHRTLNYPTELSIAENVTAPCSRDALHWHQPRSCRNSNSPWSLLGCGCMGESLAGRQCIAMHDCWRVMGCRSYGISTRSVRLPSTVGLALDFSRVCLNTPRCFNILRLTLRFYKEFHFIQQNTYCFIVSMPRVLYLELWKKVLFVTSKVETKFANWGLS